MRIYVLIYNSKTNDYQIASRDEEGDPDLLVIEIDLEPIKNKSMAQRVLTGLRATKDHRLRVSVNTDG